MAPTGEVIRGTILLILGIGMALAFVIWTIVTAEDPARRLFKWVLTLPVLAMLIFVVAPMVGKGGYGAAFGGIPLTAFCGLALAIIWRHDIASLAARPFTALYDGGSTPPDPHPAYSVAMARQKRGDYLEAIAEVRKQLDRFPTDVEGQLLLAQIQAENLHDLDAAELTIQRFCNQPNHAPRNVAFALYSMADWHLQFGKDPDSARRALETIIERFPDSEFALGAAQRIAHLGSPDMLLAGDDPRVIPVPRDDRKLGLMNDPVSKAPPERDPEELAREYVQHLERHPLDTEVRTQLAIVYADHYGRLDLATSELEQMIGQPNQPIRLIVQWLNQLADLQVRCGCDYDTVKQTLQRIVDAYPKLAAAENARKRIDLLRLELKGKEKSQAVKLGSYEQNIGLKRGLQRKLPHEL
ncbi:MAG TPA: outer membrane protein assembly factor BamD [Clostridia bacterium]|nr:outer membrane protein assembly factor BamD [Clostridia bacterium]